MAKSAPNKRLTNQLEKFMANNAELIAEYDGTDGTFPFDCCKDEILDKMSMMIKQYRGCDFATTLRCFSTMPPSITRFTSTLTPRN